MLTAAYQTDKENIKIQGEASDFIALHSTVRKVMLEAASYEQDHHEVSDFLIAFLEKLETAYDEKSFPGKPFCRACHPGPDHLIIPHQELLMLASLLNGIAQYADMDQRDQACLLLIDSCIITLQASTAEEKNEYRSYQQKSRYFRSVKAFVSSFPEIKSDFFSKHHYYER
jgi:hypothetical protein